MGNITLSKGESLRQHVASLLYLVAYLFSSLMQMIMKGVLPVIGSDSN